MEAHAPASPAAGDELDAHRRERQLEPLSVTVATAVRISGISRAKIYELMSDGRLRSKRLDGKRLVDYASLRSLLAM